jgi:hypothetical protein
MKVAESIGQLGIKPDAVPGELCIVQFTKQGARHYTYEQVANREISRDLYLATGTFAPGSISEFGGRTSENVTSVLWLVLDCDLKDYIDEPVATLREWSDGDLMTAARALAGDLREVLDSIGVTVHRIDYTGYGICAYIVIDPSDQANVVELRNLNGGLVDQVNRTWGSTLADPAVHDAGTRVTRLVGSPNTKGAITRIAQTIYQSAGQTTIAELSKVITERTRTTVGRIIPRSGQSIPEGIVTEIVKAVLPHWTEGNRHGLSLALAGILAKADVSEEQAKSVVEFIANNCGDTELTDRMKAVETSYARARSGLQTRGLYGLRDWLPIEVVEFIDRELDKIRRASASITFTASNGKQAPPLHSAPAEDLFTLPIPDIARQGYIDEYIQIMRPTTEASEGFHLGVALTVLGAMIGRTVYANFGKRLHSNLFTLLVGDSGESRKDTAIGCGITLLKTTYNTASEMAVTSSKASTVMVSSGVKIATDISSGEGLISTLKDNPNILMYLSEFARLMGNANRQGTKTIAPVLMEAFDTPDALSNLAKLNPVEAKEPYLSILAATQPRILEGLMSEGDIHSGFINRWLIIPGKSIKPNGWPPEMDREWLQSLFQNITATIGLNQQPRAMNGSDEAKAYWTEWYEKHWYQERNEEEKSMAVRHPVMAIKIALIYAVLSGDPILEPHHLEIGIAIVGWMALQIAPLLPNWGASPLAKLEHRVIAVLTERGPMKRRDISRLAHNPRRWTSQDIKRTIEALLDNGVIAQDAQGVIGIGI